jgi:hypothetical protein
VCGEIKGLVENEYRQFAFFILSLGSPEFASGRFQALKKEEKAAENSSQMGGSEAQKSSLESFELRNFFLVAFVLK